MGKSAFQPSMPGLEGWANYTYTYETSAEPRNPAPRFRTQISVTTRTVGGTKPKNRCYRIFLLGISGRLGLPYGTYADAIQAAEARHLDARTYLGLTRRVTS